MKEEDGEVVDDDTLKGEGRKREEEGIEAEEVATRGA